MCFVSFVGTDYARTIPAQPWYPDPNISPTPAIVTTVIGGITREEFDKLRLEVEALKLTLRLAKKVDELTGQPDCEVEEKVALLKAVAKAVGLDLDDVLG